jgi:hypothetical protein
MSDEVIARSVNNGGGVFTLPLFSFRHMFCSPMIFPGFILRDGRVAASSG